MNKDNERYKKLFDELMIVYISRYPHASIDDLTKQAHEITQHIIEETIDDRYDDFQTGPQ